MLCKENRSFIHRSLVVRSARREEGSDVGETDAVVVDGRGDDARRGGDEQAQDGQGHSG